MPRKLAWLGLSLVAASVFVWVVEAQQPPPASAKSPATVEEMLKVLRADLDRDAKMTALRRSWLGEFQKVLPGRLAVRAMQIDRRPSLLHQLEFSSRISAGPLRQPRGAAPAHADSKPRLDDDAGFAAGLLDRPGRTELVKRLFGILL